MSYDEELAERIRALLGDRAGLTEKKMFRGLGFMIGGNMAVAASGQGGLMVRVDPDQSDKLTASSPATPMVMRGKPMKGWLRLESEEVRTKKQLTAWVRRGVDYAGSLPPKKGR